MKIPRINPQENKYFLVSMRVNANTIAFRDTLSKALPISYSYSEDSSVINLHIYVGHEHRYNDFASAWEDYEQNKVKDTTDPGSELP